MKAAERTLLDCVLRILSHELRTPLQTVLCWTRVLRTRQVDATTSAHALEVIERSARTQAELIEDLLDVCCVLTGRVRLERVRVDLAESVRSAMAAVQPAAAAKGIRLQAAFEGPPVGVLADPRRLKQVVTIVLVNVVEAAMASSQIDIAMRRESGRVQLHVSAAGQEAAEALHARFGSQIGHGAASGARGDLDMDVVHCLVALHGGSVAVEGSRDGSLRLTIPLYTDGNAVRAAAPLPSTFTFRRQPDLGAPSAPESDSTRRVHLLGG